MENRKRNVQIIVRVTEEERALIMGVPFCCFIRKLHKRIAILCILLCKKTLRHTQKNSIL